MYRRLEFVAKFWPDLLVLLNPRCLAYRQLNSFSVAWRNGCTATQDYVFGGIMITPKKRSKLRQQGRIIIFGCHHDHNL
jgi:hypothetical protein